MNHFTPYHRQNRDADIVGLLAVFGVAIGALVAVALVAGL